MSHFQPPSGQASQRVAYGRLITKSRVLKGLQRWRIGAGVRREKERDEREKYSYRNMRLFIAPLV